MHPRRLSGKVVVIVGASSGIGRAAALAFVDEGASVVVAARRAAMLEEVADECRRRGACALAVPTDVKDAESVRRLASAALEQFGQIDVWINNAGVGAVGRFTEVPIEAHDEVIRTNLLGCLYGAHAVLPHFQRRQAGVLINTNSLGAWVPSPLAVAYSASKFGMRGYSEALRAELSGSPNIHVCDLFPAFVDTPAFGHAGNYTGRQLRPIPPVDDPRTVAQAMVSLALRPRPQVMVGAAAHVARRSYALAPGLVQRLMRRTIERYFERAEPAPIEGGNVFGPPDDRIQIDGGWRRAPRSRLRLSTAAVVAGIAAGCYLATRR